MKTKDRIEEKPTWVRWVWRVSFPNNHFILLDTKEDAVAYAAYDSNLKESDLTLRDKQRYTEVLDHRNIPIARIDLIDVWTMPKQ